MRISLPMGDCPWNSFAQRWFFPTRQTMLVLRTSGREGGALGQLGPVAHLQERPIVP